MNMKEKQQDLAATMVNKLPQLRKEYGFSQTQFGALIGKSRQQLSAIERKTAPLSWDTLLAIIMFAQKTDKEKLSHIMGKEWIAEVNLCLSLIAMTKMQVIQFMEDSGKLTFEEYFHKYYQQAFRYTMKKVSNIDTAEDITMDTFVACYKSFEAFDPQKAKFATWLYVALNNRIKNYYRDKKDFDCLDDHNDIADSQEDEMLQSIYLSEMRSALATALETLNDIQRQIVIKKYFSNMSSNEIANDIGSTPGNVRVQLTRAIKKLKEYFEDNNYHWEM